MSTIVLGGGLSGLSAAYYLTKKTKQKPIILIESSNRLGGWIKTNIINGIRFEEGPRTIRPVGNSGRNTLELIEDLGLSKLILPICFGHPAVKNRLIYVNGELHALPSSVLSIFKKHSPFSKPLIGFLIQDLFTPKKAVKDEPIYDFVNRRFGQEFADYLISSLICGICAGNAREISVNFLMKNLFEYEQKYGSITSGFLRNMFSGRKEKLELKGLCLKAQQELWSIYSFRNGMETLPKALEGYLKTCNNVHINTKTKCKNLEIHQDQDNVLVFSEDGMVFSGEHIISSIPAEKLALLFQNQHPQLSEMLSKIKCVSVGVINLQYKKVNLKQAFGFLVPPKEKLPILGVTYDSCCFPSGDNIILTVMMGGSWFNDYFGVNPDKNDLLQIAKDQLKSILDITEEPVQYRVNILKNCIPQYNVGHNENLEKINQYISQANLPLSLCGASYNGVGINDVILSARNVIGRYEQ